MRTTQLKKLHEIAIKEVALIDECEKQLNRFTKTSNINNTAWTKFEINNEIERLNKINQRLFAWYWQTLNKIMYYSNKN